MNPTIQFQNEKEIRFITVLRFILPTYLTYLFNTLYTIVDGIFVSNYAGNNALAAINIVYPLVNILFGIALAFAAGGSSLMVISMGSNDKNQADRLFSVSFIFSFLLGGIFAAIVLGNLSPILVFLGATTKTMTNCKIYAYLWLFGFPAVIGKELFTNFIRVDGSPVWSFAVALSGGLGNIILDYVFVGKMGLEIFGAGFATLLGLVISLLTGILYYITCRNDMQFCLPSKYIDGIRCMVNGASEFINQLATAITTVIFNRTALYLAGENGIAAVSIIMYLQFIFIGIYFGYSMGISPLLSYAYGNGKQGICRKLERYSLRFLIVVAPLIYAITFRFAPLGVSIFIFPGETVYSLAVCGMRLYGIGFLFSGFNIFAAVRLMSYGKGKYSGLITFCRSFGFLMVFLLIFPHFLGIKGLWIAVPAAEMITFLLTIFLSCIIFLIKKNRKK